MTTYHMCHKCGLPRSRSEGAPDLGSCGCISQSWFEYECTTRSESEARAIMQNAYAEWRALYTRQGREQYYFDQLDQSYSAVL